MNTNQREVFFAVTPPGALLDNAAASCNVIDTKGYDTLDLYYYFGATDIAVASMGVTESDTKSNTTALTSGAAISGLTFGTAADIAGTTSSLPSSTADNSCVKCEIDLRGRKRYILPALTAGDGSTGTYVAIFALLKRPELDVVTASDRGFGQILRV